MARGLYAEKTMRIQRDMIYVSHSRQLNIMKYVDAMSLQLLQLHSDTHLCPAPLEPGILRVERLFPSFLLRASPPDSLAQGLGNSPQDDAFRTFVYSVLPGLALLSLLTFGRCAVPFGIGLSVGP